VTSPIDRVVDQLERLDCRPRRRGQGFTAKCPAHEDGSPSLTVSTGRDGRALVYCFASCPLERILEALGLDLRDLFDAPDRDELRAVPPRRVRRPPTLDELADDHPAWAAWRALGHTLDQAPRVRASRGLDAPGEARSWLVSRAREAWRTGDLLTLSRLLEALGGTWPDGHRGQWIWLEVETLARDAWWKLDVGALARAVEALDELDEVSPNGDTLPANELAA
jgi:hypothetical protein